MLRHPAHRTLLLTWLGWAVVMVAFQAIIPLRLTLKTPDYSQSWTITETIPGSQDGKIYLNEPFLNAHVCWDSEYYLAIAVGGYEDPDIHRIDATLETSSDYRGYWPFVIPPTPAGVPAGVSLSYAFFPFYPLVIRFVSAPLSLLGLNPIATASLAGVLVSLLGTLAGMFALYDLARPELEEAGALRAAFYLIIFPSGFFLAQIYTEGLFVGLAFSCLAVLRRGHWRLAALLAVLATYTRAVGVALSIPLLLYWIRSGEWFLLDMEWRQIYYKGLPWRAIGHALVALAPVFAFLLWRVSYYGMAFGKVEEEFFGRGILSLGSTYINWSDGIKSIFGANKQAAAYFMLELGGVILGFTACFAVRKTHPDLANFGFWVVFLSFTSGPAQGMYRYILGAPPVFLFLSRLGRNTAFDRAWTIISIVLMGMLAMMYTFNLWTG